MGSQRPRSGKIILGIIEESLMIDMIRDFYLKFQEAVLQYSNISVEYIEISKDDLNEQNIIESPELPMNMDFLGLPLEYSLLASYDNLNISRLTRIFTSSITFLLSPAPQPIIITSLNFLAVEPIVSWLLIFFLFLVSAVMSLAITPRYKAKSPIKRFWLRFKNCTQKFKAHLWQNANQFFCEGYTLMPRSLPWRIAFMSWLLGVMFVTFEISSYLKSEFSEIKYAKVDNIDDLLKQEGKIKIGVMEGGIQDRLVAKKALTEPKFQRVEEILKGERGIGEKMDVVELFTGEVFEQVANQKLIFISDQFSVSSAMSHHFFNQETLFDFKEMYYFSEPIDQSYAVGLFSTSFVGTPQLEVINELFTIYHECTLGQPILQRVLFLTEILRWSEPAQLETNKLTLKGAESVIVLYLIGNAIAIAYFLLTTVATLIIYLYKN